MQFAPWALVLLTGVAGGAVVCAAFVVPMRRLPFTGAVGLALALAIALAIANVLRATGRLDAAIAAAFIALGACGGGYALASSLIAPLTRPRPVSIAIPPSKGTDDRLQVVLLSDAEPENYDPRSVTAALSRFEAVEVPLPPDIARPLIYGSERSLYQQSGGSPAREAVRALAAALAERLAGDATGADVHIAFCDGSPALAEVVADIAKNGAHRIVVAGLTVAWTRAFASAVTSATDLGARTAGIELEVTEPLWASPHIAAMIAQRTVAALDPDPDSDGVVLISAGEPWQSEREDPVASEHATYFAQRVRAELIEAGLAADRVRHGWLEWEEPDVSETARHLAAVGAHRIALVPVAFPVETLATLVDVRFTADHAAEETGATVVVLPAWGADAAVVESLTEAIAAAEGRMRG